MRDGQGMRAWGALVVAAFAVGCPSGEQDVDDVSDPELSVDPLAVDAEQDDSFDISIAITGPSKVFAGDVIRVDLTLPGGQTVVSEITDNSIVNSAIDRFAFGEVSGTSLYEITPQASTVATQTLRLVCNTGDVQLHVAASLLTGDGTRSEFGAQNVDITCTRREPPVSEFMVELNTALHSVVGPPGSTDAPSIVDGVAVALVLSAVDDRMYRLTRTAPGTLMQEFLFPAGGAFEVANLSTMGGPAVLNSATKSCAASSYIPAAGVFREMSSGAQLDRLMRVDAAGAIVEVAREGDTATGAVGVDPTFFIFRNPLIDDCGKIAFVADLQGVDTARGVGVWRGDAVEVTKVMQEGDTVPGASDPWDFRGQPVFSITDTSTIVSGEVRDAAGENDTIWEVDDTGTHCVATTKASAGACRHAAAGALFTPSVAPGVLVFAAGGGGGLEYVIESETGTETASFIGSGPEQGIASHNGEPIACAKDGSVYFTAPFLNADVTLVGALFRYAPGGVLETVVRSDRLPGATPMFGEFSDMRVSLNANCQFLLWGSNGLEDGLWVSEPGGAILEVARTGQVLGDSETIQFLDISSGANGFDGKASSIDATGNAAFTITLETGAVLTGTAHLVPKE